MSDPNQPGPSGVHFPSSDVTNEEGEQDLDQVESPPLSSLGAYLVSLKEGTHILERNEEEEDFGFLNRKAAFRDLLPANALYSHFALARVNFHPFTSDTYTSLEYYAAYIYGVMRATLMKPNYVIASTEGFVCAIGEVLADGLPGRSFLEVQKARDQVIYVVTRFILLPALRNAITGAELPVLQATMQEIGMRADLIACISGNAPTLPNALTIREAMQIITALGDIERRRNPPRALTMLVSYICSVAKKGSATAEFIRKIRTGVEQDLGVLLDLDPGIIAEISKQYGSHLNSNLVKRIMKCWTEWVPENALRVKLTVLQTSWEGLTGYKTILDTLVGYPDFPWATLYMLPGYSKEFVAFSVAIDTVSDDEYYGFNRDLGNAAIRNYRNLASACANIASIVGGDTHIMAARCFADNYASKPKILDLITKYINAPRSPDQVGGIVLDIINKARSTQDIPALDELPEAVMAPHPPFVGQQDRGYPHDQQMAEMLPLIRNLNARFVNNGGQGN
ncbi:putative glycoprotein [Chalcocoris rutilans mononega-like virus 2]|uniref:Glycoprotein n=1 Tax=Chalcocoris rutilans mononega-like virus 2 TaxID=2973795 RepID=A0A916LKZ1_9VIRU|nr:putative glycoprotein [Chalcocoris rutilans mononega-like virus 2]DAZ90594.1 TPA_asm: nucleoprotein [Chalcocoris rutilans mononega-like virus 2]